MFKKLINVMLVIVMVAGIIVSVVGLPSPLFAQRERPDEGGGGGSSTAIYSRHDYLCPDRIHEKTNCLADGNEQCTAQYCNN